MKGFKIEKEMKEMAQMGKDVMKGFKSDKRSKVIKAFENNKEQEEANE